MAELLIVVAIIGVLGGVSFVAVQSHQRSLAQLERDTIAKEIYFAAQNHLTMVESQGLLKGDEATVDSTFYGNMETEGIFYAVANGGDSFQKTAILDLMLPFGAIDETVRAGGFYIIRYQANPAIVLDVFYCSRYGKPEKFNYTKAFSESEYNTFRGYSGQGKQPKDGYVVGWYGGAEPGEAGKYLETPSLTVTNGERLTVTVTDPNKGIDSSLKLIVKGVTSEAQAAFVLAGNDDRVKLTSEDDDKKVFTITLDDISKHSVAESAYSWHFADLNKELLRSASIDIEDPSKEFIPGEDIVVVAVAFSNDKLTNIAYSNEVTTNSLYADVIQETTIDSLTGDKKTKSTAIISCIRHLENLDQFLSGREIDLTDARQVEDLDWSKFKEEISDASVCKAGDLSATKEGTKPGCYLPVNPGAALTYDGNHHAISNIVVDTTGEASTGLLTIDAGGVFGALDDGSCVKNLEIRDITVTLDSGNAGALVGTLTQSTALADGQFNVSNVVAYNTVEAKYAIAFISTGNGNAGGLIGETKGAEGASPTPGVCRIEKSAAAVGVSSAGGNAGGLIGKMDGGEVVACYSGGHTVNDTRTGSDAVVYDPAKPNVKAEAKDDTGGVAGGLIGDAGAAAISYCYSTCSVGGVTAGGLVGSSTGNIAYSYATGLVQGSTSVGALAGTATIDNLSHNYFFEIINERPDSEKGYVCLSPVGGSAGTVVPADKVRAMDESAVTYNDFSWPGGGEHCPWKPAEVYNDRLKAYYGAESNGVRVGRYNLKTVEQLYDLDTVTSFKNEGDETVYFVTTHHGDWPAPEIFVINAKGATP